MTLACNTRILAAPTSGIPRYVVAMLARLPPTLERLAPSRPLNGAAGHLWEQGALPLTLGGRLLWSPANTGPLTVARQVVTIHDLAAIEHPEWFSGPFAAWYRFLLPRLVARVHHVVTVSAFSRGRILDRFGLPEDRVSVVPGGVDARFVPQPAGRCRAAAAAAGLASPHYFLSVSSLEPRKNLKGLLKAWTIAAPRLPGEIWLVIAGEPGPARIFAPLGFDRPPPRVHLAGRVAECHLPALMSGALAFVYPSFYEGFGLPPLEAMACGAPCLTSDQAALVEVADGASLSVPATEPEALAEALLRLADDGDLRQRLRARGLARAAIFDWDRAARHLHAILARAA